MVVKKYESLQVSKELAAQKNAKCLCQSWWFMENQREKQLHISLKCLSPELNAGTSARSKHSIYGELSI